VRASRNCCGGISLSTPRRAKRQVRKASSSNHGPFARRFEQAVLHLRGGGPLVYGLNTAMCCGFTSSRSRPCHAVGQAHRVLRSRICVSPGETSGRRAVICGSRGIIHRGKGWSCQILRRAGIGPGPIPPTRKMVKLSSRHDLFQSIRPRGKALRGVQNRPTISLRRFFSINNGGRFFLPSKRASFPSTGGIASPIKVARGNGGRHRSFERRLSSPLRPLDQQLFYTKYFSAGPKADHRFYNRKSGISPSAFR